MGFTLQNEWFPIDVRFNQFWESSRATRRTWRSMDIRCRCGCHRFGNVCVCVIVDGLLAVGLATNILKNLLVLEPRLPPFLVFVIHVLYTSDIH